MRSRKRDFFTSRTEALNPSHKGSIIYIQRLRFIQTEPLFIHPFEAYADTRRKLYFIYTYPLLPKLFVSGFSSFTASLTAL